MAVYHWRTILFCVRVSVVSSAMDPCCAARLALKQMRRIEADIIPCHARKRTADAASRKKLVSMSRPSLPLPPPIMRQACGTALQSSLPPSTQDALDASEDAGEHCKCKRKQETALSQSTIHAVSVADIAAIVQDIMKSRSDPIPEAGTISIALSAGVYRA